ncbi:DUF397 domain-containing protein [Streptomyces sp. NPDC001388]|uniref:DUF397 domain-containing protein n=1 Tax=Streptomyces sp. NPDC001388 TaxID=3364568 RepID=UPI003692C3FB
MNTDLSNAQWFKSSYSSGQGACVEVAHLPGAVAARDSKDPDSPVLAFPAKEWQGFIHGLNAGEFRP